MGASRILRRTGRFLPRHCGETLLVLERQASGEPAEVAAPTAGVGHRRNRIRCASHFENERAVKSYFD